MTVRRTIAELAHDREYLRACLAEVEHEIATRAGEVDPPDDGADPEQPIDTAIDKAAERKQKATK